MGLEKFATKQKIEPMHPFGDQLRAGLGLGRGWGLARVSVYRVMGGCGCGVAMGVQDGVGSRSWCGV
jgi:hypothetical protein